MKGIKTSNEYCNLISSELYEKIPKTVLAAIAVSALCGNLNEGDFSNVDEEILKEWQALFANGIVPQKPISKVNK